MRKEIYSNHFGTHAGISQLLIALAAQEGCDGEPYDEMQEAGEYIYLLEKIVTHVENSRAGQLILRQLKEWRELPCTHDRRENITLPDGEGVQVCRGCGVSRSVWEQGQSDWMMVDIDQLIKDTQKRMDSIKEE